MSDECLRLQCLVEAIQSSSSPHSNPANSPFSYFKFKSLLNRQVFVWTMSGRSMAGVPSGESPENLPLTNNLNPRRWLLHKSKTKLCVKFQQTGLCVFGSQCLFAHGDGDLQTSTASRPEDSVRQDNTTCEHQVHRFHRYVLTSTRTPSPSHTLSLSTCLESVRGSPR
jgi:hypothetical protein